MSKILITSGCSFTETTHKDPDFWFTWPVWLFDKLKNHRFDTWQNSAMGSQGNGLISRGVFYNVCKALEKYDPADILVGVMWSGSTRLDYRCSDPKMLSWGSTNQDGWIENPTQFVKDADKFWVIMNNGWQNEEARLYHKYFFDFVGSTIYSIEHILRLQLFLESKRVPYFFTNFADHNIIPKDGFTENHPEISYLYKQIDVSKYLPVTSMHRWCYEHSSTREQWKLEHLYNGVWSPWIHPRKIQHQEFVDKVVYPYLIDKKLISPVSSVGRAAS